MTGAVHADKSVYLTQLRDPAVALTESYGKTLSGGTTGPTDVLQGHSGSREQRCLKDAGGHRGGEKESYSGGAAGTANRMPED